MSVRVFPTILIVLDVCAGVRVDKAITNRYRPREISGERLDYTETPLSGKTSFLWVAHDQEN